MDFHNRQYDPQIGRFLSVDPLAASRGQDQLSHFQAMGNNPVSMVDPLGLVFTGARGLERSTFSPKQVWAAMFPTLGMHLHGGSVFEKHMNMSMEMGGTIAGIMYTGQQLQDALAAMQGSMNGAGTVVHSGSPGGGGNEKENLSNTEVISHKETKDITSFGTRYGLELKFVYTGIYLPLKK